MTGERSILAVAYTPISGSQGLRRAVAGFLKYIQHRDQHPDSQPEVEGLLKYVSHRDRTGSRDRLFNREGQASDANRRWLASYVARSVAGIARQGVRKPDGVLVDRGRAVYRFVLSPEFESGLDLHHLARATMAQLEADAGGLGPWIAAEHRNTGHPHIHIVLAGRREVSPGCFRTVLVTRPRLQRMKAAMICEITRQRELERLPPEHRLRAASPQMRLSDRPVRWKPRLRRLSPFPTLRSLELRRGHRPPDAHRAVLTLRALARHYRRQMEREIEEEQRRREREGWMR
jgi:hypothetical protein